MISKTNLADPIQLAESLSEEENLVFLYSGTDAGKKSYIAWDLESQISELKKLKPELQSHTWFGYLGYELKNQLEDLSSASPSYIEMPNIWFGNFKNLVISNIEDGEISAEISRQLSLTRNDTKIKKINSNMTDSEYLQKAADAISRIKAGELYEANLTRKFYGNFASKANPFEIFCRLAEISPAQYSAYIKIGNKHIICASPERFLKIENGIATTSPIKGTMPLTQSAEDLANSEKDKAENLMIVDLMRNDLSKTCSDVKVEELFKVITHKKYHHMHSTITAKTNSSPLDVVLGCFPPGSMTGTPKIKAMEVCNELEQIQRGIYSGAIGWLTQDACDFNVVIRTIIIEDNKFEFQAGGAIVADSTPEKELEEINIKIAAIKEVLNVR